MLSPQSTTLFSLPPELHFQILSYLPFSSHIVLSSIHPFFASLLQDSILRSKRYYTATYPGIHKLLKDYTLRIIVLNNDFKTAKVEVLQLQQSTGGRDAGLKSVMVARLHLSTSHEKERGRGRKSEGILDDYWLWVPLKKDTDVLENMDLRKIVVLLKVSTPLTAAKKRKDKRTYWSTEYPFRIARPNHTPSSPEPITTNTTNSRNHKNFLSPKPPMEPTTLRQMVMFITKRVIKETGLKNEREVKITLRVCKLGGNEGYVGFTGEVEVEREIRGGWGRWFGG